MHRIDPIGPRDTPPLTPPVSRVKPVGERREPPPDRRRKPPEDERPPQPAADDAPPEDGEVRHIDVQA